jgi:hypothetical protein
MKFCNGQTGAIHGDRIANVAISQDRSRVCDGQGTTSDIMCDDGDRPKMLDLYFWISSDREMGYKSYQTSEHCSCRMEERTCGSEQKQLQNIRKSP